MSQWCMPALFSLQIFKSQRRSQGLMSHGGIQKLKFWSSVNYCLTPHFMAHHSLSNRELWGGFKAWVHSETEISIRVNYCWRAWVLALWHTVALWARENCKLGSGYGCIQKLKFQLVSLIAGEPGLVISICNSCSSFPMRIRHAPSQICSP